MKTHDVTVDGGWWIVNGNGHRRLVFAFLFAINYSLSTIHSLYAMGRIPKKVYDAKVSELNACGMDLSQAKSKIDALQAQNAQLMKDMATSKTSLEERVAMTSKEKEDLAREKEAKEAEVEKLKSTYQDLMSDMKKEIEQGTIQITQLKDKLSVNLVDKILFNSGEAEVNAEGKKVLQRVANVLKKVKNKQIRIEGHTDSIPISSALKDKFPSNWELSTARATTVARYLTEAGGGDPKIVSAAGYAHFRPIADNITAEGRAKNRRIEIALVPMEVGSATPPAAPAPARPDKKP